MNKGSIYNPQGKRRRLLDVLSSFFIEEICKRHAILPRHPSTGFRKDAILRKWNDLVEEDVFYYIKKEITIRPELEALKGWKDAS